MFVTAILVTIMGMTIGCAADDSFEPESTAIRTLVDHRQWVRFDGSIDPLATHQPDTIECGVAGWYEEYGMLEINTGRCNYPLLEHPALVALPAGSLVTTQLVYYDLVAPEPAEAHVAIVFGDAVQWESMVAIPQSANVLDLEFESNVAVEAGDPIRLHLHNHGQNFWSFGAINVRVPR